MKFTDKFKRSSVVDIITLVQSEYPNCEEAKWHLNSFLNIVYVSLANNHDGIDEVTKLFKNLFINLDNLLSRLKDEPKIKKFLEKHGFIEETDIDLKTIPIRLERVIEERVSSFREYAKKIDSFSLDNDGSVYKVIVGKNGFAGLLWVNSVSPRQLAGQLDSQQGADLHGG